MKINDIVKEIHDMAKEKGWWDSPRRPAEIHMLIVSEIAEATEAIRNNEPAFHLAEGSGKPEGEAVELADAIIRIMDYAGHMGWDLEQVIRAKVDYNAKRPYRHGGKSI